MYIHYVEIGGFATILTIYKASKHHASYTVSGEPNIIAFQTISFIVFMKFYYSLKKYVLGTFYVDVMNLGTATVQFQAPKCILYLQLTFWVIT